jgi:hypothetical protein
MSLYAHDAALFIGPSEQDINTITEVMEIFADASGLFTNISKIEISPIRCDPANLPFLQNSSMAIYIQFPLQISWFAIAL